MATDPRHRQREEYGGINWGSAFFGWLVAVAIAALLTALFAAAGATVAIGEIDVPEIDTDVEVETDEISVGGAIGLVVIALIGYFAGGYVAGRMSRFDGARQGLGVWIWAVVVAAVLAIVGWLADQEYNVFAELDLPRIPADETVTGLGVATLIAIVVGSLLAAIAGGRVGVGYHARVDEAAYPAAPSAEETPAREPPAAGDEERRPPPA